MAITYLPDDKYAFLFTGPTTPRFMKDLENVFGLLTEYYNYPPGHIMVVFGSPPPATPTFPGAHSTPTIASAADLDNELATFAALASGPAPLGWNSALVYLTGGGVDGPVRLVIDGAGALAVDPAWLAPRLGAISACHVNVVAQQAFGGGFQPALTGSGLTQWSFTYSCASSEGPSFGNAALGGYFTDAWVRGLKMMPLPAGTADAGSYADQLGSATEATNLQIAMAEAEEYAHQIFTAQGYTTSMPANNPGYADSGSPQYLGEPAFLIRDGSPSWWESPDIVLSHPNHPWVPPGDFWIPDPPAATPPFNNTITVTVRNKGTHPVRRYSLGLELFRSPAAFPDVQHTACDEVPAGGLLLPIDLADIGTPDDKTATYEWNTRFDQGLTHECIKAECELLCADVDFSWNPTAEQNEAQRNTDEMTIVPPPPPPLPFPGLQGFRRHRFGLHNPFEGRRLFWLLMPEALVDLGETLDLTWFAGAPGQAEELPLAVVPEPVPHIPFLLDGGGGRDLVLEARMGAGFPADERVSLPFQILVAGDWGDNVRATGLTTETVGFAPYAGFTLVLQAGGATLKGTVLDREGQPAVRARVFLRTVDDLQGATVLTGEDGGYAFVDVNADVYRLEAVGEGWRAVEQTVVLTAGADETLELKLDHDGQPGAGKRVRVILDRIRILNDKDPCLKGKGEIVFAAEVVPDRDASRRQVTRLPARGVYKVSQKAGKNDLELGVTIFDGLVKSRALAISIAGEEVDLFDRDDALSRYHREFGGDPDDWAGAYHPFDEYLDREDVKEWALWYRIVCD